MISIDDYRAQCERFFADAGLSAVVISEHVSGLSIQEFQTWQQDIVERYDTATKDLIRALVAGINFDEDEESDATRAQRQVVRTYREINDAVLQAHVFDLASVQAKFDELHALHVEEARQRLMQVTVEDRVFTAEHVVDVLWSGWECDGHAWLVRDEGVARLVTTDHGSAQFSGKEFLQERLAAYQDAMAQTQAMLDRLND